MFNNLSQTKAYIRRNRIKMVDLKFSSLLGKWHHITVPAARFDEKLMRDGVGFDASSVGLRPVKAGDMVILPDLTTAFMDPFTELPTLSFICSAYEADTREPFIRDPRNIAARAEQHLKKSGIADKSLWGPEYEFYVFDSISYCNDTNCASYKADSREAEWNSRKDGQGYAIRRKHGYEATPPHDQFNDLRSEITDVLESLGVKVKYHHHEVGGPGQCEIETPMMGLLETGDKTQIIKYVIRMCAKRKGLTATFMPKPLYGEAGSGMHFHQHIFRGKTNLFYGNGYGHMSPLALSYIAGLLHHGPSLLGITNPSTNSYCRLVPGYEAPVNCFFSLGNRAAAIRIPKYAASPDSARMEFRPPDATCNIYLALAAQLLAGIDGIKKKMDPSKMGFGPYANETESQLKSVKPLPFYLGQAIKALDNDHEYLLAGEVFDEGQIQDWIGKKREEQRQIDTRPHPYEMELYFDA